MLFVGVENNECWLARKGVLQRYFPLDALMAHLSMIIIIPMVHLSMLTITTNGEHLTGGGFSLDEIIQLGSLEFIIDHFDNLSLSREGSDSDAVFMGMAHNRSPSLHTILEESASEDDSASSEGGSSYFPIVTEPPQK
jgi:hypothetical protein